MISVIMPTLNRPKRLQDCIMSLRSSMDFKSNCELIVIIDSNDYETISVLKVFHISFLTMVPGVTPVEKWNYGLLHAKQPWIMLAADDIVFSGDWINRSLNTPNRGFLGFHDEVSEFDKGFMPHYMATREWLKTYQNGVLCVPHYKHWGPDLEICARAIRSKTYAVSTASIRHKHVFFDTQFADSTYDKAKPHYQNDVKMFYTRRENGFPDDFTSIL